jgi:tripartite-type tricarboxylate transporter receptor subunit TctC
VALTWYALSGPAGLPDDVVQKLHHAVSTAWTTPTVMRRLAEDAIVAEPMSPQAVTAFVTSEVRKWGPISRRVMGKP